VLHEGLVHLLQLTDRGGQLLLQRAAHLFTAG
jgi:hypothetical protein